MIFYEHEVIKMTDIKGIISRLKESVEKSGYSYVELEKKTGIAKSSIQRYVSGTTKKIPIDAVQAISKAVGVSAEYVLGWEDSNRYISPTITDDVVLFPVIGEIAAGYDEIAVENWNGAVVEVPASYLKGRDKKDFFVLEVRGNSMYPLYQEKDIVLILKQNYIDHNGDVGAVIYDGECATLKRIDVSDDMVRLSPINPEYQPKELRGADLEMYHILGVPRILIREIN